MNDFTIEELEEIANCVYAYEDLIHVSRPYILLRKIHRVIDNYCEHTYFATTKPVCTICNKEI